MTTDPDEQVRREMTGALAGLLWAFDAGDKAAFKAVLARTDSQALIEFMVLVLASLAEHKHGGIPAFTAEVLGVRAP